MLFQTPTPASPTALAQIKDGAQIVSYLVGAGAAWFAWRTYQANSRRESAKWAVQLYEKFYEQESYREIREALDCDAGGTEVEKLVLEESAKFTDYLNFFELVCFLAQTKQITTSNVTTLFDYYLKCLKRHPSVIGYINKPDHGFEQLREYLGRIPV